MNNIKRVLAATVVAATCTSSAAFAQTASPFNPVSTTPLSATAGAPGQSGGPASTAAPGQSSSPASTVAPGRTKNGAAPATPSAAQGPAPISAARGRVASVPANAAVPAALPAAAAAVTPLRPQFYMSGYISGNTLTITAIQAAPIRIGTVLSGNGIQPGTTVVGYGTGTGGVGTYLIK